MCLKAGNGIFGFGFAAGREDERKGGGNRARVEELIDQAAADGEA